MANTTSVQLTRNETTLNRAQMRDLAVGRYFLRDNSPALYIFTGRRLDNVHIGVNLSDGTTFEGSPNYWVNLVSEVLITYKPETV